MNGIGRDIPKGWNDPPILGATSGGARQRPKLMNQRVAFPVYGNLMAGPNPVAVQPNSFVPGQMTASSVNAGNTLLMGAPLHRASNSAPELQHININTGGAVPHHVSPTFNSNPQQFLAANSNPQQFSAANSNYASAPHQIVGQQQPLPSNTYHFSGHNSAYVNEVPVSCNADYINGSSFHSSNVDSTLTALSQHPLSSQNGTSTLSGDEIMEFLNTTLSACATLQDVERKIISEKVDMLRSLLQSNVLSPTCFSQLCYLVQAWRNRQLSVVLQVQTALFAQASESDKQWLAGLQLLIAEYASNHCD